jgi:hypothetical protein
MWNDKPWYYCSKKTGGKCDRQYRCHEPKACEGRAHKFQPKDKETTPEKEADKRKLKLVKAYQATLKLSDNEMEDTMSE